MKLSEVSLEQKLLHSSNATISWQSYGDLDPGQQFAFVGYAVYCGVCFITAIILLIIMAKVIKKVGSSDKVIPTMLVMLQLSLLSCSVFFIDQCLTLLQYVSSDQHAFVVYRACQVTITTTLTTLFLALAVLLNISKWIYFTLRI